ncbi:MAG: iron-sulfur cluster assembly accessory protein [Acidobacteria bacterium]|nr:iron-sulfur cluster assembly accessory protein [Acidobacteriota bacterium]
MAITITEKAAGQIKELMRKHNVTEGGLRVGVKGGGCSGLMYSMDLESNERPGDQVFETDGVKVFCDMKSYLYLDNMTLDYSEGLMQKGFVFNNPNATHSCGCGQSFS